MVPDPEIDRAYPARWIGKVTVETNDGRMRTAHRGTAGDPGNPLTRAEIEEKALRLADSTAPPHPPKWRNLSSQRFASSPRPT